MGCWSLSGHDGLGRKAAASWAFCLPLFHQPGACFFPLFWYFEVEVSNTTLAVKAQWRVCPVAGSLICCSPRCHWRVDNSWSVAPHQTDASKLFFELFGASFVSQRDSWLEFWELCHLLAPPAVCGGALKRRQKTSYSHGRVTCRQWNVSNIWSDHTCH